MKQFSNSCLKHVFGGLLMAIMFFAAPQTASATHIVGGDLTYRCLGNNQYEVVLMIRRDCLNGQAPFDAEASIGIFDENGVLLKQFGEAGEIIIPFDDSSVVAITSDCTTSGEDVCVEQTTYVGVVTLPFAPAGYTFGYQRCCFNNTVDNIVDPLDTGFTSHIDLSASAQSECNSSPSFNQWPDIFICQGEQLSFDASATDTDGDELVYSLCTPSDGATMAFPAPAPPLGPPYADIVWENGYSAGNMLGSGTPLEIDMMTGEITAVPGAVGQYLVGICVSEFRNGELLSTVRRVFEYNVAVCNPSLTVGFDAPDGECEKFDYTYTNTTTSVSNADCTWSVTDASGTEIASGVDDILNVMYPGPGTYTVSLNCSTDDCDDSASMTIVIDAAPPADIEISPEVACGVYEYTFTPGSSATCTITFTDANGTVLGSMTGAGNFDFGGPGVYNIESMCGDGDCSSAGMQTIDLTSDDPVIGFEVSVDGCQDDNTITATNNTSSSSGIASCEWVFTDIDGNVVYTSSDTDATFSSTGATVLNVSLTCTNNDGCANTASDSFTIPEGFDFDFMDVTACPGETATVLSDVPAGFTFDFTPAGPVVGTDITVPGVTATTSYTVVISDGVCTATEMFTVSLGEIGTSSFGDLTVCVGESVELNPNADANCTYFWSSTDPDLIADSNEANPVVSPTTNSDCTVVITKPSGCEVTYQFSIIAADLDELGLEDIDACSGDMVVLNDGGNPSFTYVWSSDPMTNFATTDASPVISVGVTTVFTVTASLDGCSVTESFTVNALSGPEVNLDPSYSVCEGGSVTVDASGSGTTWMWMCEDATIDEPNGSVVNITPNSTSNCSVIVSDGTCETTASFEVVVLPSIDLGITNLTHCPGSSVTLDAGTAPGTYDWDCSDGSSPTEMNPTVSGPITCTLTYTSPEGCVSTGVWNVALGTESMIEFPDTLVQCQGSFVGLNPNGTDMYNYTWSPAIPGLDVNATNPMVSLLTSQTFTVTVVSPDGCEQVATVHVDVKENPEINFTPDEYTVCAGGMICLALGGPDTGSGGMTGSGSMTGSGVFTGSGTTTVPINPAITGSGTVVWTDKDGNILSTVSPFKFTADEDICIVARITDEFGCVGMDTVNVFVAPAIDLEAGIIGDGPFCIGDTLQLEATGNGIGDDDVSWYDDSGVFLGNGLNIVTTYTGNSPYHVQADNGLGCIEVVDIDIPEADPVNLMVDVADDGCGNYIFTATGNTTIIEYWCEIPFELIGTSNPGEGFAYNCFADKNIIVRGISPDGCIEDVVIPVTTGGAPGVDILYLGMSVDTISVCPGEEIMLEAVTDPAGLDVEWDPSGETTPTITVISEDGEICVTTIDPATGCESTDCVVVVTDGGLAVTIEAEPAEFCLGEEVTLTAVSMPEAVECTWSNGDTGTTITVTPAGVETYSVTCVDANGCEGVTEITLTPSSKDVEITGPATLCEGEDGIMSVVNPDPNCTYEWSTGDTGDTATAMGPGTYDVTATDPVTGCTGVATLTIGDGFGGDLTANADPDVISAGQTSTLCVDNPQAGWTYEWTDPDGNVIGTTECIDVNPNETTTYTVCVTNADGCVKCTTVTVTVEVPTCTLDPGDIPNMFTPNGDGSNDCYQIENFSGYSFAKLMIYDRWGEQVFMTMNPDTECWDGTFNGELLNPDVYGYHLTYECEGVDGETTEVGNITLLR